MLFKIYHTMSVKIKASDVKTLRKATGAGMMDCKKALQESGGDFEKAIEYLRKKGQKLAAKRADRTASEGVAIAKINGDGSQGVAIVLSCETDFVAKNADFISFTESIANFALQNMPANKADLLALDFVGGLTLNEKISEQIGKIGEKIELSSYEHLQSAAVVPYIHAGNKIGVLVGMNQPDDSAVAAGKDIAMQVAAMSPVALDESSVPQSVIDKELEIGRELARNEGKPEKILDKIAQGRLRKFYRESTLLNQNFVKGSGKESVKDYLKTVSKGLKITNFKRVAIG